MVGLCYLRAKKLKTTPTFTSTSPTLPHTSIVQTRIQATSHRKCISAIGSAGDKLVLQRKRGAGDALLHLKSFRGGGGLQPQ